MTDRNIKVGVEVDASDAKKGMQDLGVAAQDMSRKVKKAGEEAGQGLGGIGEGSEKASEKIDRTSKSIIQSIQRTTVALESGGRTTAKYYETIANQRGVSVDALRPYLEQLKAVESAQGKFTQSSGAAVNSLNKVGISAAQTAAAMRNVPAQFTDIVTSLQGGQAPLTVLLQQGGQLKDMFGGIGNAAGALGKYMLSLISPFTLLAGAAVAVGVAYNQGSKEAQEFNKALVLTGNAAGTTTNQLMDMAKAISSSGASTQGAAAEALAALAGTGKVGVENLQRFASVAVQTQKIVGTSVQDTAKAFADLAKSPLESSLKLDEQYNFLTVSIYKQIKALQDQGNTIEAAKVAQNAYADALAERTAGIEQNLGSIERGWMNVTKFAKGAWDAMLGVGRDTTESERIEQLQRNIANRADFISRERPQSLLIPKAQADNAKDQAELNLLLKKTEQQKIQGELKAKEIALKNAGIEFDRQGEKFLTSALKLETDIAKARKLGADAGLSTESIEKRVAAIRKDYAEKNKKTRQEQSLEDKVAFAELKKIRDAEKEMEKQFADDTKQFSQDQIKRTKEVTDSLINQISRQDKAYFGIIEQQDAYRQSLQDNADLMQLESSLMGQSATDRNTAIEQYKIQIALKKELLKIEEDINLTKAQKTQLSESATENANIAKSQVALKVQQDEWSKFYADIYNGLTDSLYRGFEAGKGFFQSFWDGIKNLFKTTVLKLAVQGVMTGVSGTFQSALSSYAQNSGNNSFASIGKSIWDGFSLAGTVGGGLGQMGGYLGSTTLSAFASGMSGTAAGTFAGMGPTLAGSSTGLGALAGTGGTTGVLSSGAGAGTAAAGAGSSAAAALPIVGWILAGMAANNSLFGQGWGGKASNSTKQLGIASGMVGGAFENTIQKMFGLSDKTASMLSGSAVINRLFGYKNPELQQSELSGSFGAGGYSASVRDVFKQQGGLFRGDKWGENINKADSSAMTDAFKSVKEAAKGYASILGLSTDALDTFTKDFKVNLSITGDAAKDAEANQKILTDILTGVTNDLSNLLAPALSGFAKEGESASATLQRLATGLSDVNLIMRSVGFDEFAKSLEGSSAATRLSELTGGIEKLASGAQYFFENFLTDAEKIKPSADLVTDTLKRLGQSSVDTVDEFRTLVQGLDLATESGAKMYAELIEIAPQFKAVADYTKEAAKEAENYVDVQFNAQRKVEVAALEATQALESQARATMELAKAEKQKTYDDMLQGRLRSGKIGEIMAANYDLNPVDFGKYTAQGAFDAAGFNSEILRKQAKLSLELIAKASADAINVEDVAEVIGELFDFTKGNEFRQILRQGLPKGTGLANDVSYVMFDFIESALQGVRLDQFSASGEGIINVINAQDQIGYQADLLSQYNRSLSSAGEALRLGIITQQEYTSSIEYANKFLQDQIKTNEELQSNLVNSGIESIAFYFEQIGKSVEELNKVAAETALPLSQVTSAIGRLTSIADIFGMSAKAAGGKESGIASVANAELVASAAAIAAGVITSADAAAAAKLLADKTSFAGVDKTNLRDISLIFEGLKEFDARSFENSFMRMNDALNKGAITQEQYQDIFDQSLNTYQGLDSSTKAVADAMEGLRKSMGGFADQLLIDKQKTTLTQAATMDELLRQYEVAKVAAMTGEASSVNKFQDLANQVLDVNKYGSRAEYNAAFGAVYRDARNLENVGARQGENVVAELKNLNKSQTERIDKLEDALINALTTIAKNTKDTVSTLELAEIA